MAGNDTSTVTAAHQTKKPWQLLLACMVRQRLKEAVCGGLRASDRHRILLLLLVLLLLLLCCGVQQ